MSKKWIALLLSIGMAFTLLTSACKMPGTGEDSSMQSSLEESSSAEESSSLEESSSAESSFVEPEKPEYTIVFRQEGAADIIKTVEEGATLTDVPSPNGKVGYTVEWDKTDFSNVQDDMLVTATYVPNVYKATYDADGFAIDSTMVQLTYDAVCEGLDMSLTQTGKIFLGWNYNGVTYTDASVWKVADDVTLTAEWMYKDQIVVTFVDADGAMINRTVYKGESLTDIPTPKEIAGHTVDMQNWYADEGCTTLANFDNLQESITVYAKATPNVYVISFVQEGQPTKTFNVVYGQTFTDIPTPAPKTGYTVTWNRTDFSNLAEDVTVIVVEKAKTFTIIFEVVGGEVSPTTITVTYGKTYSLPDAVSEEYKFDCWTYNGEKIKSNDTWLIDCESKTITLTAKWGRKDWSGIY